ncbi:MAG: TonB C-terminal domain-containing protein [Candidatus Hydrogenedentes bacterium]|nr:TonB C-terminal domain-containing protein [Candidatus Hydrogenedentota bacterium]
MDYRRRMRRCFAVALALHLVVLALPAGCPRTWDGTGAAIARQPLVLSMKQKEKPVRLIEAGAPATEPVDPNTDLISEQASKAQDMSDVIGERNAPFVPKAAESDELRQPGPAPEPAAPPQEVKAPAEPPAESPPAKPPAESAPPAGPEKDDAVRMAAQAAPAAPAPAPEAAEAERVQIAKAEPPQAPQPEQGQTRGRVDGGVKNKGFLSFEAMESDFAPYLREVRNRVERRWKSLIQLRYSGSSTTKAVVDCASGPDGKLVSVAVVEPGESASYAGLCKEAIERAGPFPPFPFKVPDVYRNQNLEIRWTFSFL